MQMQAEGVSRRDVLGAAGAAIVAVPALANAETEYANVPYLGGSDQVCRMLRCRDFAAATMLRHRVVTSPTF